MSGEPTYIELGVRDANTARAFYGPLLGWAATGENGPGQVSTTSLDIGIHDGDETSIFEVFFLVDDLGAALARVTVLGGRVVSEVHDSPGFGTWAECDANQGVRFGLRQLPIS
jgi:uncharacterized protein